MIYDKTRINYSMTRQALRILRPYKMYVKKEKENFRFVLFGSPASHRTEHVWPLEVAIVLNCKQCAMSYVLSEQNLSMVVTGMVENRLTVINSMNYDANTVSIFESSNWKRKVNLLICFVLSNEHPNSLFVWNHFHHRWK